MGHRARRTTDVPVLIADDSVASITDVARLAGVSTATVSRVVSEAPYAVSAATRERVLDAARELDYVPNALARGLLKSYIPVVGVIVHDITDPYFSEVVRGVEDAASRGGFLVITCSSDRDPEREHSYVRLLRSMRAATLIFAGSGLDDPVLNSAMRRHTAAMRAYGAAVVHLSPHASGEAEVGVDNAAGIASMIAALAGLGHRQIAFLAGPTIALRGAPASGRVSARPRRGGPPVRRAPRREHRVQPGGRRPRDRPAARRRGAVHRGLRCERPPRARRPAPPGRARHRRPGPGLRRGLRRHPDGSDHGAAASRRCDCRSTRSAGAASSTPRGCSTGSGPRREVLPTELVLRESTGPAPR